MTWNRLTPFAVATWLEFDSDPWQRPLAVFQGRFSR